MSDPTIPQHVLDLARRAKAPQSLTVAGLRQRFGDPSDVEVAVGQVWRARWEQISVLLLVLAVDGLDVVAVPVTVDPPAGDDRCLILDAQTTTFGVEVTAWAGLAGRLPVRVLEQPVDVWADDLVRGIEALVASPDAETPIGARRGRRLDSPLDPDLIVRAELEDDLDALRSAPALPVATPGHTPRPLRSMLGTGPKLSVLLPALRPLGLSQADVMSLLHGKKPVTPEVAEVIARVTGMTRTQIAAAVLPLPPEFVAEVDQPRWRPRWQERAESEGVDEATARLRECYEMFALAARQTGGTTVAWKARLAQYRHGAVRRDDPENR